MQLIDELKRQAEHVVRDNEQATGFSEALLEHRRSEVIGALAQIHGYLNTLIEQLHVIQPRILTHLDFNGLCRIAPLHQKRFRQFFEHTFHEIAMGMTFLMECHRDSRVILEQDVDRDDLIARLQHFGLDVHRAAPDALHVDGHFSANLLFRSNFNEQMITLTINNVETTRPMQFELQPETITDALLDEMGNFILRKENRFIALLENYRLQTETTLSDSPEDSTLTDLMQPPRLQSFTGARKQLFLTYRENLKEITSGNDGIVLGRGHHCDLTIPSDRASREHARIVFRRGRFVIADHSTNGTFVKMQGNKEVYIHGEDYPLSGTGFISLGESTTIDNEHLIYFSCQ